MLIALIIIALLAISALILVHEFGHFAAAKLSGVWVEEFGIGLPPRIWGKKIGETIYSINWLPMGGFVRLHGEDPSSPAAQPARSFQTKSPLIKIFIATAGIIMNYVLAIACLSLIFWFTGVPKDILIVEVASDSPAEAAGLLPGDQVIKLNDHSIQGFSGYSNFQGLIAESLGQELTFHVLRADQELEFNVLARTDWPADQGPTGISFAPAEVSVPSLLQRPFVYTYYGVLKTYDFSLKILAGFGMIFSQLFGGHVPDGVAGPVGVTALFAEIAKLGLLPIIEFSGIISINLALLNLIPFPPLDGSRVVFVIISSILGKRLTSKAESLSYTAGMALLILLVVILTAREIPAILSAGSLSAFVDSIIQ